MSRTHTAQFLSASILPLVLMACGSSSSEATASTPSIAAASSAAAAQSTPTATSSARERLQRMRDKALPTGDCTLLGEAAMRRHFPGAPAEMEVRVRAKPYSSCTYLWATATSNKTSMAGRIVEIPGEGRLTLTLAPVRVPESDWKRVLESYRIAPPVAVAGIGDKAVWSDQRHQLSVLVPKWVLHVAVEDNDAPGTGRDKALAIARDILKDLK